MLEEGSGGGAKYADKITGHETPNLFLTRRRGKSIGGGENLCFQRVEKNPQREGDHQSLRRYKRTAIREWGGEKKSEEKGPTSSRRPEKNSQTSPVAKKGDSGGLCRGGSSCSEARGGDKLGKGRKPTKEILPRSQGICTRNSSPGVTGGGPGFGGEGIWCLSTTGSGENLKMEEPCLKWISWGEKEG